MQHKSLVGFALIRLILPVLFVTNRSQPTTQVIAVHREWPDSPPKVGTGGFSKRYSGGGFDAFVEPLEVLDRRFSVLSDSFDHTRFLKALVLDSAYSSRTKSTY